VGRGALFGPKRGAALLAVECGMLEADRRAFGVGGGVE